MPIVADAAYPNRALPVGGVQRVSVGWWGVLCLIATEASLFAYLLFSYFYYAVELDSHWMPGKPSLHYALPAVILLILSSGAMWWAERGARRGARLHLMLGTLVTLLLGIGFAVLQVIDWMSKPFTLRSSEYGSIFFTITGIHLAHLVVGLIALVLLLIWSGLGYFDSRRHTPVLVVAAYWHFVVAAGVAVFLALYVTPYLG